MYYSYILLSKKTGQYYIGQTNNLQDRILRHNTNRNKWTKNKGPWTIAHSMEFKTRSEAMAMEKKLKNFKNKDYLTAWIAQQIQ